VNAGPGVSITISGLSRLFGADLSAVIEVARVADEAERGPIWEAQKRDNPGFADYETKTSRQIPVVILEPAE